MRNMQSIDSLSSEEKRALLAQLLSAANKPKVSVLSFAQQRLWFLDQLMPGNAFYNLLTALRLKGRLDLLALAQAFHAIIQRHEMLRTTFQVVHGNPAQFIAPTLRLAFPLLDLRQLPPTRIEIEIRRLASKEAQRHFDLARGPLLCATLLRIAETEHVLLLSMHHIITDGWSLGVFLRELAVLYNAYSSGEAASLPELPIQYADYAVWQRERLQGDRLRAQLAYWRRHLAGAPQALELPTDHPRPLVQTFRGAAEILTFPQSLAEQLKALSRSTGATLFMTLLAGWQVLLYRYSGQEDILVGSPIAGRNRRELESLIGCFVNTLTLRTDLSGNPSFYQLLQRVREVCLGAYAHQELPFERLVEDLQPKRVLSHHPLFQVIFSLQTDMIPPLELAGLQQILVDVENSSAKFDLGLLIQEHAHGLVGEIEYSTDLFDAATISRLLEHYRILLTGIVSDPGQRIAHLPLLTAAEQHQLLISWNTTSASTPAVCICELFARQAARVPDAIAVVFDRGQGSGVRGQGTTTPLPPPARGGTEGGRSQESGVRSQESDDGERQTQNSKLKTQNFSSNTQHPTPNTQHLSYRELNARANRLAHHLRALGVGPDVLVGLCVERSLEMLVGILGILKAGGAYVPLDPRYPAERLAFMLEDSQATVLLTQKSIYDLRFTIYDLPSADSQLLELKTQNSKLKTTVTPSPLHPFTPSGSVVDLVRDWPSIAQAPPLAPISGAAPEHLAYVIYTSGSTGRPKGVMVTRRGLLNLCYGLQAFFDDPAVQTTGLITSISFDISVNQIFPTLLFGRALHIISDAVKFDSRALLSYVAERQIHVLDAVPSYLQALLADVATQRVATALRYLVIGGEKLEQRLVQAIFEQLGPQLAIVNIYGLTEITDVNAFSVIRAPQAGEPITLERPLQNNRIYLTDRYENVQPVGVVGEVCIAGESLARGYLGRPGLTAEKFVPCPFEDGALMCRTGDVGRRRADGALELLGRIDAQVKVRGFRIELGEIEAVLGLHPSVREAAVIVREDAPGGQGLVAYVVPKIEDRGLKIEDSGSDAPDPLSSILYPLSSELRAFLRQRLPDYMIPASFVLLDALPLGPTGKLDRRALPALDTARPELTAGFMAPRDDIERAIAAIWQDVLQVDRVGVHDNFFDLGGHSLLLLQVLGKLRDQMLPDISAVEMFQYPTISLLAEHLTRGQPEQAPLQDAQLRADTRRGLMDRQRQLRSGVEQS